MDNFEGSVAVVTGAAGGLGLALSRRLAAVGARVAMADVDAARLDDAAAEVRLQGGEVLTVTMDVSEAPEVAALRDAVLDEWGGVDVLCNNAGVAGLPGDPLWELSVDEWQRVIGVNFWGVIHGVRAFVPVMLASGNPGCITNTASMTGLTANALIPHYVASKHAVIAVSETLRIQLAARNSRLTVTVLCPGAVATELLVRERAREAAAGIDGWDAGSAASATAEVAAAQAAELVADQAVEAMRAGTFWVLPAPDSAARISRRMNDVLAACPAPAS
jgi:NAD(P)-dependent dehydrogenase (short-subunit alcohol dehydrogenase family)